MTILSENADIKIHPDGTEQELETPENVDLGLRKIARSETSLGSEANFKSDPKAAGDKFVIRPWGNYTIVASTDSDNLRIYNDQTQPVTGFDNNKASLKTKAFSPKDFMKNRSGDKGYLINDVDHSGYDFSGNYHMISKTQDGLIKLLLLKYMRASNTGKRQVDGMAEAAIAKINPKQNLQILEGGKYILFLERGETDNPEISYRLIAFQTQNDQGITQAPKDWVRYDINSKFPEDLKPYIQLGLERNEELRPLNEKYYSYITEVGINIVPADNPGSAPLYKEDLVGVGDNVCMDSQNNEVLYYCAAANPKELRRLDMSKDPAQWDAESAQFAKSYPEIRNLQMDPSGNFLLFYSEDDLVLVSKDSLEEVKRVPGMTNVNFDAQGRIRALDNEGHLVIFEMDGDKIIESLKKKRFRNISSGVKVHDIFAQKSKKGKGSNVLEQDENLTELREQYEHDLKDQLQHISDLGHVKDFKTNLATLRQTLIKDGLKTEEADFVTEGLASQIVEKEKGLAGGEISSLLSELEAKVQGSVSLATISESQSILEQLAALELLMDEPLKRRYREATKIMSDQSGELYKREADKIMEDLRGLLQGVRTELDKMSSKNEFDDWMEFRYPQLKSRLGSMARDCPIEADVAYKGIIATRGELQQIAEQYKVQFEREYVKVREAAAERMGATAENLQNDVDDLINRLRSREFKTREQAESYLGSSEAKRVLEGEIATLTSQSPEVAKELERQMKVHLSNALSEIERGGSSKIAETGQQMIIFGNTEFPRWEAKVKEHQERKVELVFDHDEKSRGPGVTPKQILGDVGLLVTTGKGTKEKVRLYEGWDSEHEWRFGLLHYRGQEVPPSYVTGADFSEIRKQYAEWSAGKLKNQYEAKKRQLFSLYKDRVAISERTDQTDDGWKERYQKELAEYGQFCADNHIALFRRIDRVQSAKETDENGKGYVPSWQSHWVVDADTEQNLEKMAQLFKMQMTLHEGMLDLKGHAGTGKDVLIKMFCNRTNRPYFSIDCTKWTTEYELSEDVVLEAKDGGTQTVKVPSAIMNGIQTPGAMVYFNEFNAMPEQAQIFLHALLDEKRSLTLKTSSGQTINADPSVLLSSSMNPNYEGTFNPQFATRSRIVSMEIDYPSLKRSPDAGDTNPNKPYNASEPLRIAREVDSLTDLTYEPNLSRNEFVKLWNQQVNGIDSDAAAPTPVQKFDMSTILALVEFGDELRKNFKLIFDKSKESRNALPVTQPLTSREFRRCAYALSQIPDAEKASLDPDNTARDLLERFFLSNIDNKGDRDKVKDAMKVWNSKIRVAA